MRKVGKYEKMRKRALLQTYMISLASLMLCVTMFLGTTMAWFTSEVEVQNNELHVGTLDVTLSRLNPVVGADDSASPSWTKIDKNVKLFQGIADWMPGNFVVEGFQVKNAGTLPFDYKMTLINSTPISDDFTAEQIAEVANQFIVYVHAGELGAVPNSIHDFTDSNGWKKLGNLNDVFLKATNIFSGKMTDVVDAAEGSRVNDELEEEYHVALVLSGDATDEAMGKSLTMNVKFVATQTIPEDTNITFVSNEVELREALESDMTVVLASDIEVNSNELITIAKGETVNINLNGHTLDVTNTTAAASCAIENNGELTIWNGTVTYEGVGDASNGYGTNTITNSGKLVIDGATIINTTDVGSSNAIDNAPGATLVINDGTIKAEQIAIRVRDGADVTINGGEISGKRAVQVHLFQNVAADTKLTITGGTFTGTELALYSYAYGSVKFDKTTINISGGIFNGDVAFGGGNKEYRETVNITGGTFNGELGRYIPEDENKNDWEPIAKP